MNQDFPGGSDGKESSWNVGDLSSILGLGRPPGEGAGSQLQYSCLGIPWTEESHGYSPVLMFLSYILYLCWFCFRHLTVQILFLTKILFWVLWVLPANHWNWWWAWSPLMPVINYWSPGVEGFLGAHLIADQERSGNFHGPITTCKELNKGIKKHLWSSLCLSNLLIMWIFNNCFSCLHRFLRVKLWRSLNLL